MSYGKFLVDTSAIFRMTRYEEVWTRWKAEAHRGRLGVCSVIELEVRYSARSKADFAELSAELDAAFNWTLIPDRAHERAKEVQAALSERGQLRSAEPVDLIVAAAAEVQGPTVLHYDADFETVAAVTGQPVQWVAERGSVD